MKLEKAFASRTIHCFFDHKEFSRYLNFMAVCVTNKVFFTRHSVSTQRHSFSKNYMTVKELFQKLNYKAYFEINEKHFADPCCVRQFVFAKGTASLIYKLTGKELFQKLDLRCVVR